MRVIKRSLISIIRRGKKNVLTLCVIGVVMTLVLTSLAIQNAVKKASDNAKQGIRPVVVITADVQKTIYHGVYEKIYDNLVEKVSKLDHVEKVIPKLKVYSHSDYPQIYIPEDMFGGWSNGGGSKFQTSVTNWIQAMDDPTDALKFADGYNVLHEGVFPIDSEEKNPMLISKDYAEQNKLQVGDVLNLGVGETLVEPMAFTICGIFRLEKEAKSMMPTTIDSEKNMFYSTYEVAKKAGSLNASDAVMTYTAIRVKLDKTENIDAFIAEAKEKIKDIEWENYKFTSGIDTYKRVTASVDQVGGFSTMLLWIAIISATMLLMLVMILSLKARKYEWGVLLSMGESKRMILFQVLVEAVFILVIAFVMSFVLSSYVAKDLGDSLLESAAIKVREEDPSPYNFKPGQGKSISIQLGEEVDDFIDPIRTFDVDTLNGMTVMKSFLFGFFIILVSTAIPVEWMMMNKAKTLMLRAG